MSPSQIYMRRPCTTPDDTEAVRFHRTIEKEGVTSTVECSAQYTNQALRTLRRMLSKAVEWKLITSVPKVKMSKAYGRDTLIDPATERTLLEGLETPVKLRRTQRLREQIRDFLAERVNDFETGGVRV